MSVPSQCHVGWGLVRSTAAVAASPGREFVFPKPHSYGRDLEQSDWLKKQLRHAQNRRSKSNMMDQDVLEMQPDIEEEDDEEEDDDINQDEDIREHSLTSGRLGAKGSAGEGVSKKTPKPGIIYMSRIPPLMRPQRIKKIFSQYGEIGRVFLQAEDKFNRKSRKKKGGSKSKRFTEGWIEFMDKKIAKSVAVTFNNTPIGGKKRSMYYEELWNLKYLHRFQWAHLVERLEYERQVRQQRIRTEISQAKRETNFYMKSVELGDHLEKMEKKRRNRGKDWIARTRAHKQKLTQEEFEESKPRKSGKVTKNTLFKIFKKTGDKS